MADSKTLAPYAGHILNEATIAELPRHYRGKVRDNYDLPDGTRLIIATDRISAFDRILAVIPLKGQVLTQIARYWFEATADICENHVVSYPDPNVVLARRLEILPVEIVVRDYLAGTTSTSVLSMYKAGQREMYGHQFADGLKDNQKLPETIVTPTSKADYGGHDEPLTASEIVEQELLTQAQWDEAQSLALRLFARGREIAAKHGLILVDTKYEFGFDADGKIVLADEIHTPDSSRYWFAETYDARFNAGERPDSFDKDFVRNWVVARCDPYKDEIPAIPQDVILDAAAIYINVFEKITGKGFDYPDASQPVLERIRANLKSFF